jgi:hypothetical protein
VITTATATYSHHMNFGEENKENIGEEREMEREIM